MGTVVVAMCSLATVVSVVVAGRTVYQRDPLWQLLSGMQFAGAGMMVLLVISRVEHSSTLDLFDMAYALAFVAYGICVWNVQKRAREGR